MFPSTSSDDPGLRSYDHILAVMLDALGKSDLLVQDALNPQAFWQLKHRVPGQSGGGALSFGKDM